LPLEVLAGLVAHQLESIAALDECLPFGDQPLQLDGLDLGAVLFALAAPLRLLVIVELSGDAVGGAMEDVGGRPQQVLEIGLEAGVAERGDESVEDVGDGAGDGIAFGKRARVGFVLEGTEAVELQLGENVIGRRRAVVGFEVVVGGHEMLRRWIDRDPRGLHGDGRRRAGRPCTRGEAQGRSVSGGPQGADYFASRCKGGSAADGK
jgi:hypothetical protein